MRGGKQRATEPWNEALCDPPNVPSSPAEQYPGARSVPGPYEGAEDDHKGGIQLHVQACTVGGCRLCPTREPSIDTVEREGERRYRHHTSRIGRVARGTGRAGHEADQDTAKQGHTVCGTPRSGGVVAPHFLRQHNRRNQRSQSGHCRPRRQREAVDHHLRQRSGRCDRRGNVYGQPTGFVIVNGLDHEHV